MATRTFPLARRSLVPPLNRLITVYYVWYTWLCQWNKSAAREIKRYYKWKKATVTNQSKHKLLDKKIKQNHHSRVQLLSLCFTSRLQKTDCENYSVLFVLINSSFSFCLLPFISTIGILAARDHQLLTDSARRVQSFTMICCDTIFTVR